MYSQWLRYLYTWAEYWLTKAATASKVHYYSTEEPTPAAPEIRIEDWLHYYSIAQKQHWQLNTETPETAFALCFSVPCAANILL